jgi:hypothetical protein
MEKNNTLILVVGLLILTLFLVGCNIYNIRYESIEPIDRVCVKNLVIKGEWSCANVSDFKNRYEIDCRVDCTNIKGVTSEGRTYYDTNLSCYDDCLRIKQARYD